MTGIKIEDIQKIRYCGNLQFSKDGKHIAYTLVIPDKKDNNYGYDICVYNTKTKENKRLTYDGKNFFHVWEDDTTLLIAAEKSKKDKAEPFEEKTVYYRLSLDGGEAVPAFTISANVNQIIPAGDGKYVCRILTDWNGLTKEQRKQEKDYHVLEEVPFWGNGRGFVSGKRNGLYLFDEKTQVLTKITNKYTNVAAVTYQDGKILYTARKYKDMITMYNGLFVYDMVTGTTTTILKQGKYAIRQIAFGKEGIFFSAADMKKWGNNELDDIFYYDGKTIEKLLDNESLAIGDAPMADTFFLSGKSFIAKNEKLYFIAMKRSQNAIYQIDTKGKLQLKVSLNGSINGFDTDGRTFAYVENDASHVNRVMLKGKQEEVIADWNADLFADTATSIPESFQYHNQNGDLMDGWLIKPADFDEKKKYPGILEIHGGPRAAYGDIYYHEMQVLSAQGYFVFFTNPRGSEGYGETFADIRGKYGTVDYEDLMYFTDLILEKYPNIDRDHLGACGGSYGGFLCNWIEGHTDRFKAICSQRSISNWVADFGASEIGVTFDANEMQATPWRDTEKMWDASPLKYADQAKTPILFIHSLQDYNCPIDQGVEMFTAMKYFHVPSRMVLFEGENHSLSRSGKPQHRVRRLQEIVRWFDIYLKGKKK